MFLTFDPTGAAKATIMQKKSSVLLLVVASVAFVIMASRFLQPSRTYTGNNGLLTHKSELLESLHFSILQTACCIESEALTVQMIIQNSSNCSKKVILKSVQCNCESLIVCKLIIVSAISDNHFEEATDFIASVQAYMPKSPIIMYNLGLSEKNKKNLSSYCDVKVRDLNFRMYPKHVQNLGTYAWKPLIINEMYKEENGKVIFWGDASCRVRRSITPLFPRFSNFPIIPGVSDIHFFISTTHDGMMKYLRLNKTRKDYASIGKSLQANVIMLWLDQTLQERFLKFWVDCALHEECIAPKGAIVYPCDWKEMKIGGYACHRYDQAAYNAILTREFGFDFMKEMAGNGTGDYFFVERFPTQRNTLLTEGHCNNHSREKAGGA